MTPSEFIREIEEAWNKELSGKQAQIYRRKLERFGDWQLDDLLEKVLESCKYRPKLADVWVIAKELGYFKDEERQIRTTSEHTWETTSCPLCGGDGRLIVFMAVLYERDEKGQRQRQYLRKVFRASDGASIGGYRPEPEERDFLFRCLCPAGDAETLPASWPKWKGSDTYQARGQVNEEEPKARELDAVHSIVDVARNQPERELLDEIPF